MTLEELKKRATASELTLIEATEAALREALTHEMKKSVLDFVRGNPLPERYEMNERGPQWFARLGKHLNPDAP